ncbi:TIR-like protein FxsC [Cryptosporangium japonicum]|uniref:TIR domain-containing protein n=1 Tax=Cryptosporangium japonicum TaxID=80872 RepID=A0ABN0TKI9_9ACTN
MPENDASPPPERQSPIDPADPRRLWFFLSYSRSSGPTNGRGESDRLVKQLFDDLNETVAELTTESELPRHAPAGFLDQEDLRSGAHWRDRLAFGLATCRVFVPLYALRYFDSPECGREWNAFTTRQLNDMAHGYSGREGIVPILWTPVEPGNLPEVVSSIQLAGPPFPASYSRYGVFGLLRMGGRFRADYRWTVHHLAERIVEVGRVARPAPGPLVPYDRFGSSFGLNGGTGEGRRVQLTVVAPPRTDCPPERSKVFYGGDPRDWKPYHPVSPHPIADHAGRVVQNLDYRPEIRDFSADSGALLADRPPQAPVVLLIDPWAAVNPPLADRLATLDSQRKGWIGAAVAWSETDQESRSAEDTLRRALNDVLSRRLEDCRRVSRAAANGLGTLEEFTTELPHVVALAVRRFFGSADSSMPLEPPGSRPRLGGPPPPTTGSLSIPPLDDPEESP